MKKNVSQTLPEKKSCSLRPLWEKVGVAASKLWNTCHTAGNLSGYHPTYKEESLNKDFFRAPLRFGFTLIELLVVVLIIGILAAVALPQYQKAVLKSRFTAMMPVVDALVQAERLYYQENGTYTKNLSLLDVTPPQNMPPSVSFVAWFNSDQTSGAIMGNYQGKIRYLRNIIKSDTRECRANKDNALAVAICASYGEYVDTYDSDKAYKMKM